MCRVARWSGLIFVLALGLAACGEGEGDDGANGDGGSIGGEGPGGGGRKGGGDGPGDGDGAFTGTWQGTVNCQGQSDENGQIEQGQFQDQLAPQFDANGDYLVAVGGKTVALAQSGQNFEYVLDGGGVGVLNVLAVERGADVRRYQVRVSENRTTNLGDGWSETYDYKLIRADEYRLQGGKLQATVEIDETTLSYVTGGAGSTSSRLQLVGTCTGTLDKR